MESKSKEIQKVKQEFEELLTMIFSKSQLCHRLDEVERHIFKALLRIGKQIIVLYINHVVSSTEEILKDQKQKGYQNKGLFPRTYFSIFGKIVFSRRKLYSREENRAIYPADKELGISKEAYSFHIQDWIGFNTTDMDFRSSVEIINRIFGYDLKEMQAERISNKLSEEVEDFYEEEAALPEEEGRFYAAGFDDKGIPILPADVNREADSSGVRLGKGEKRGVKKSSTVSVTYSFNPNVRTAEDVIESLFKEKKDNGKPLEPKKQAQNKHIRAFISDKKKAIEYGFENIQKRSPGKKKNIVVLIDGDRGLEQAVNRATQTNGMKARTIFYVLDFIHVTEYIWKAANIYYGEKSLLRLGWVKKQCLLILQGKLNIAIRNLQKLIEDNKYKTSKYKVIKSVVKYLKNHQHMMNYKECLTRGFPISTGAIESACGHFVQSRMERNGMRWSLKGAQNMLNLRAVNKNKNWDCYMQHYIEKKIIECEYLKRAA